ncbi:PapG chaperone-binding domain-containing protein [Yersinia enterocolitica]
MRFLFLCAFITSQFSTQVYANDKGSMPPLNATIYGFVWTTAHNVDVGRVDYNGNSISSIPVKLNTIGPLQLSLANKYCRTTNHVPYGILGYDYYLFFPKTVMSNNGVEIPISIGQKPSDVTAFDKGSYYALYKKVADHRISETSAKCWDYGTSYNFPSVSFDTSLIFDVRHLDVGHYSGSIPIRLGFVSYHGDKYLQTSLQRWTMADIDKVTTNPGSLSFDITINNKCDVSPSAIELSHGGHSITSANGHTAKSTIKIECQLPSDVKFKLTLKSLTSPTTSYYDGVGVGLGNGWDSVLTVENTNISASSPSADMTISKQGNLTIKSVLKKTTSSQPGNLSGSAVMEISIP